MLANAGLVVLQALDDIRRLLPAQLGHRIHLRIRGAVVGDAVASGTHLSARPPAARIALAPSASRYKESRYDEDNSLLHGRLSEPINQDEHQQPDDVDEMPIPGCGLECELVIGREVPAQGAAEHDTQHGGAYRDVQPMKAGEKEEGGAVGAARERQAKRGVGAV